MWLKWTIVLLVQQFHWLQNEDTQLIRTSFFQDTNSVKIGLLLSADPAKDPVSLSALQGAQLALITYQQSKDKLVFELVPRSCDGPWGITSNQVVDFVYKDNVSAVVSSVDGRNAHLAEQVATKTHVPLIGTKAGDPTLTQAYVPWFFRIVPDDRQISDALIKHINNVLNLKKIALIVPDTYDAKKFEQSYLQKNEEQGYSNPKIYKLDPLQDIQQSAELVMSQLLKDQVEGIIFASYNEVTNNLMNELRESNPDIFLISARDFHASGSYEINRGDKILIPGPAGWNSQKTVLFKNTFRENYGYIPGYDAVYAYDAVSLLISVVQKAGPNREKIKNTLKEYCYPRGITGEISFDMLGNRISEIEIYESQ